MTNNQEIYENKRNEIIRNNNLLSYFNKGMFVGMATAFLLSSGSYFAINRLTSPAGISETERIEKVQKRYLANTALWVTSCFATGAARKSGMKRKLEEELLYLETETK